jgi:hypothetical protein
MKWHPTEADTLRYLERRAAEDAALGLGARSIPEPSHNKWAMLPAELSVPMGAVPGLRTRASHDRWLQAGTVGKDGQPGSYQLRSRVVGWRTNATKAEQLLDIQAGGTVRVIKGDSDEVVNVRGFGRKSERRASYAREATTEAKVPETARIQRDSRDLGADD